MGSHDTQIRRLRPDEWRALRELRLEALREAPHAFVTRYEEALAYPDDDWRARAEWPTFVADGRERLVGMAVARTRSRKAAVLTQMYIRPDARGSDVARRLVDAVAAWARGEGFATLELGVHVDNERAARFYEKCGFVRTGETRHIDRFGDDVRMSLSLVGE